MRDRVLGLLRSEQLGMPLGLVLSRLRIDPYSFEASVVEALLLVSPEVRRIDGTWRAMGVPRRERIVAAVTLYSDTTGKRLFRASAALDGIPVADQPTGEELAEILRSTDGQFTLLPNAMIKRNA